MAILVHDADGCMLFFGVLVPEESLPLLLAAAGI
jgi:hypothetical protein